jgi:hypothetical protein
MVSSRLRTRWLVTAGALLALSVPATFAGEAPEPSAGAAGETLIDTITIDATADSTKTGTVTLKRGTRYRLEVTGTMTVSGPLLYDAVYCYGERTGGTQCDPPRRDCCIDGPGLSVRTSTAGGHVRIDCNQDAPDTCSNATGYQASHIYSVNFHPNNDGKLTAIVRNATSACDPAECGETTTGSFTIKIYGPGPAGGGDGGAALGQTTKPLPEAGKSVKATSPEAIAKKARRANTSVTNSSGTLSGATVVADDKAGTAGEAVAACWLIGPDALNLPEDDLTLKGALVKQTLKDFAKLEQAIDEARRTGSPRTEQAHAALRFNLCVGLVRLLGASSSRAAANGCPATRREVVVQRNRRGRAIGLRVVRRKPGKRDVRYSCAVDGPGAITITADGRRRGGLRDGLGKKLDFGVVREPGAAPDSGRLTFKFGV